jgi:hypothetical protein
MTQTRIGGGVTVEITAGAFAVVTLPGFGVECRELAAKVTDGAGQPLAVVLYPLARWNMAYGGWARDDEWRFQAAVQQIAEHFGGTPSIGHDPL